MASVARALKAPATVECLHNERICYRNKQIGFFCETQATAPHVSRAWALDWLCLNLQPGQLPRSFAAGAHGAAVAGAVKVVAASDASRGAAAPQAG